MQLTDPRYYDKKVPRSIRLNNSGAIEYGPFTKKYGAIGSDGRYAIFPTDGPNAYGVKAHGALLSSYGKRGLNTLSAITQRWAPNNPKDPTNNPAVYAADVASKAGIRPDTPITPDMYARVIHAMSRHEAGRDPAFTVEQAQALLGGGALPAAAPGATEPMRPRAGMAAPQQAPLDISAISPEQAATLAKMGMRTGRAPQNVGEGLHYIGETINNAAWRNQLLDAFKTGNAQSNAAWQSYAGGGMAAPAAAPAQVAQQPSPVAPAGGMAAPGSFRGAQEAGMAGAPVSAGSPAPSAGSAGPVGGMADPRLAQLDAEISRTRAALANPATRSFAMQRLQKLEDQKFALSDPMRPLQMDLMRAKINQTTNKGTDYGKAGTLFTDPQTGKSYTVQFASDGSRKIQPVEVGGAGLVPDKGVMTVDTGTGTRVIDKSRGGDVRQIGKDIVGRESEEKVGAAKGNFLASMPKMESRIASMGAQNNIVTQEIDRAIAGAGTMTTGIPGMITSQIPGTQGYSLANLLKTIRANVGFDKLQQMRDESPTGGALGQVAVQELEYLQAVLGSLEQKQDSATLVDNLNRLKQYLAGRQQRFQEAYQKDVARFAGAGRFAPQQPTLPNGWTYKGAQ